MRKEKIAEYLESALGGEYKNVKYKKSGGMAMVFIAKYSPESKIKKLPSQRRIIKILKIDKAQDTLCNKLFKKEIEILDKLEFYAFPNIYKKGTLSLNDEELPYYVTDFYEKGSIEKYLKKINVSSNKLKIFKQLIFQTYHALDYLHTNKLCHLDIKKDNILITEPKKGSPQIRIIDFGASEKISKGKREKKIISTQIIWPDEFWGRFVDLSNPNRAPIKLKANEIGAYIDLHMAGKMLIDILKLIGEVPREFHNELSYLNNILVTCIYNSEKKDDLIKSASEVIEKIEKYNEHRIQTAFLIDGYVRVPGLGIRHFSSQIRDFVDTRLFQRLRKIRQLALAHLVFPGALHSRFEHSLGVLENSMNYITALCCNGNAPWFLQNISKKQIKYIALYSLLHDVCHYPYSHIIDEVVLTQKHEDLLLRFLNHDRELFKNIPRAKKYYDEIIGVIKTSWEVSNIEDMISCVRFLSNRDASVDFAPDNERAMWNILRDIVNGPIDADKLDYLVRDSHHCGVPYSMSIDKDRLFASLSIEKEQYKESKLIVSYKGRVCAETIAVARYMMFSEVYWGHAVRSFSAMLKICFEELLKTKVDDEIEHLLFNELKLFSKNDDDALDTICSKLKNFKPAKMLSIRKPYVRLLVLSRSMPEEVELYKIISGYRGIEHKPKKDWIEHRNNLINKISKEVFDGKAKQSDIIIDIPDPHKYNIEDLKVSSEIDRGKSYDIGPLWTAVKEIFEKSARKIRIFVNPELMPVNKDDRKKLISKVMSVIPK